MAIDSTFWVAISFIIFFGGLVYLKVPQKINEILNKWEEKRKDAAEKGTLLHEKIEDFYNEKYHQEYPIEFSFFKKFHDKYPALAPYRTEWRIFDGSTSLAGTVDMVYKKKNGELFIFDWKRSKKLVDQQGNLLLKEYSHGLEELSHVADNSFNRYALQQNIYKYILESNYGVKVSSILELSVKLFASSVLENGR